MNKIAFIILLFFISQNTMAEIYKWVDDNGVTHYGRKPKNAKSKKVDVKEENLKPIPKGAKKAAKQLLKDYGNSKKTNCSKAVSNALYGIDSMREVGKKNYNAGYISSSEFLKTNRQLINIRSEISISHCNNPSVNEIGFYKCMSNDHNHFAHCAEKHLSKK